LMGVKGECRARGRRAQMRTKVPGLPGLAAGKEDVGTGGEFAAGR